VVRKNIPTIEKKIMARPLRFIRVMSTNRSIVKFTLMGSGYSVMGVPRVEQEYLREDARFPDA